jgi:hypothetical protein
MKSLVFSAENVVKSIDGKKSQTRRVMKVQPPVVFPIPICDAERCCWADTPDENFMDCWPDEPICSPLKVGDKFYAKERFGVDDGRFNQPDIKPFVFFADGATKEITQKQFETFKRPNLAWHSPWFLPEFASRFVGEITGLRAERVRDCADGDAIAEGFETTDEFDAAWKQMYGVESWERDWVWVYEYKKSE